MHTARELTAFCAPEMNSLGNYGGQQQEEEARRQRREREGQGGRGEGVALHFAAFFATDNQKFITIATFAAECEIRKGSGY